MPYWQVYNGWRANGRVRVLLEADSEDQARGDAAVAFQAEADREMERERRGMFGAQEPDRERWASYAEIEEVEQVELPLLLEE